MSSKQTAENEKDPIPQSWLPESKKAKPVKLTHEEMDAELQKMFPQKVVDKTRPKIDIRREDGKEYEYSINTDKITLSHNDTDTAASMQTDSTEINQTTSSTISKRVSGKQRKESLEEYRQTFLVVPRLEDRKPVFVSREVRDRLDEIVRKLGGRRMSVSGFVENLARHHLEIYREDIDSWKKL
ncbi:DUF3408 domain-containing protein [Dysgonomonas sp. Marseille-P4361]|uniref:DUF3408 domain-containing protein n=1 Tax=Dysgonomonas sp. Marseille-P4361 TaxID=2161820 RepID=UPI002101256D|nr:DUF3408 domain-containing protein [Dysgonomonas sp. Marseille-P4361]